MDINNTKDILNQTNDSLLNNVVSNNSTAYFLQNPYISLLWDNFAIFLLFILFLFLVIKIISFSKKLIIIVLISSTFPFFLQFLNSQYILSFNDMLKFSVLGGALFVIYYLMKPLLSILKKLKKNKKNKNK